MEHTKEVVIESLLTRTIKRRGGWCIKLICTHITGLPDRLCLMPGGKMAFAELKTTGKKPTPIQKAVHSKLRAMGFEVEVIDTLEGVMRFIDRLDINVE